MESSYDHHRQALVDARSLLESAAARPSSTRHERAVRAVTLASALLGASQTERTRAEVARSHNLSRLMEDPSGLAFTTDLTDRAFRSQDARRLGSELSHLLSHHGLPRYLSTWERLQLLAASALRSVAPSSVAEGTQARIRRETRGVLLSADPEAVRHLLQERHHERTRVNLNQLGEALLGEEASEARVEKYSELARRFDIDALSIKVSSIGSQLHPLAFDDNVRVLSERLARIYRATLEKDEARRPVVMLDMEAYKHTELTLAVLTRTLETPELSRVKAGIVLQAYLPESPRLQRELTSWAAARTRDGGAPIRLRIVKGANLAAERVESAKAGYRVPMLARKVEVDANYKHMLELAITESALSCVALGVASHNVFDLSYAMVLAAERGLSNRVGLEMLEGMANPLRRTLSQVGADVLVYAPICAASDLNTGIAYLVRRLEENTSGDNFLSSSFGMRPHDPNFERERIRFLASIEEMKRLDEIPRRSGESSFDRTQPAPMHSNLTRRDFDNEPDTDFTQPQNRRWIEDALARAQALDRVHVGSLIAGEAMFDDGVVEAGKDPSRPDHVPYVVHLAGPALVERALKCAADDPARHGHTSPRERAMTLRRVAMALRKARGELIALMVLDGGKRVSEADAEVSEAVDFAEYYAFSFHRMLGELGRQSVSPRGVVVVTPPWNFPLAIPAGGVLAAWMAGNRVILKPAPETVLIASRMVEIFHAAGMPAASLQLVVCDDDAGSALIRNDRVDAVILTGATDTARLFQRLRKGLHLLAETGGKNAYIVSAMSDRDQATADVVYSAFGHAGQKCSATSLLILEAEVHDDPHFMATLKDAVESLVVGSAWDPRSVVTPLIKPPSGPLKRAMEELAPGESWLVKPSVSAENPCLVSPGVKLGVAPGSFMHTTELFGPILAVLRAHDLDHAIEIANGTGYGLTAGLASLDEREQAEFVSRIHAGNVYVNRTTTGAIVERQPFGGVGKSGFGPGAKAGGPNYVVQLSHVRDDANAMAPARVKGPSPRHASWLIAIRPHLSASAFARLREMLVDYAETFANYFGRAHDPARVLGQENSFRYLPEPHVALRAEADASALDVFASALAARLLGVRLTMSLSDGFRGPRDGSIYGHPVIVGSLERLRPSLQPGMRLRLLGSREHAHATLAAEFGLHLADAPVLSAGRLELLHYLREQSVSADYHRYGQLPRGRGSVVRQAWK